MDKSNILDNLENFLYIISQEGRGFKIEKVYTIIKNENPVWGRGRWSYIKWGGFGSNKTKYNIYTDEVKCNISNINIKKRVTQFYKEGELSVVFDKRRFKYFYEF